MRILSEVIRLAEGSHFLEIHISCNSIFLLGLFIIGSVLLLQALLYCSMPISTIISGAVGVD